ncbi:MAG: RICIN domain-containing protein, partial [Streptosporangiaceae bacterium]
LNIPLGSATLTGTLSGSMLTVTAAAPTALPSSLPSWLPNPSYVSTQISIDESTDTLTLSATTGTSGGQTATLTVTIASASTSDLSSGTDVTGSLVLGNVPFAGGSTASLDFTLGYSSGALSASLSGTTTSAAFPNEPVTIPPGATLTLATGSGLSLSGTADINSGSDSVQVTVDGTLSSLTDWTLTVSDDTGASQWSPATGLSVTPDFSGSITDTAGAIGFDLASAGSGPAATWVSSDTNINVSVNHLEVSNQAPSSTADCSTDEVKAGDLWIGLSGGFSYAPDNVNLQATGCFDLTGESAAITATGDLTSEFGSSLPFTVTDAEVTAKIGGDGTYSLTGSASLTITQGVSGDPSFNVGLSLSNTGIIAGIQIGDLSTLDSQFSGSGVLYVSTSAADGFNPDATFGFTDQPSSIDLKAGLDVSLAFTLPTTVIDDFQQIIPGFPDQASVQSMATLSSSGFTVDVGVALGTGTGTGGVPVASDSNTGTAFYLDHLDVELALGDQNQVTLSGTGYLVLPALAAGGDPSSLSLTVGGYFNITSLTLGLTFNVGNWTNDALGISGLSVQDFGGSFGLTLESGVPTPSLGIYADNLVLPASWSQAIGVVPGTEISFDGNLSLSQPVLSISFTGQNGQPALTPLSIDPHASTTEINSFTVNTAALALAPFGGTTSAGDTLQPGVSVTFDANIAGVAKPVDVEANIDLAAPSIYAQVYVGNFSTGPVQVTGTTFYLAITPTYYSLYFYGGISDGNYSFSAGISLQLGSTAAGGGVSLVVTGGLPSYLEGYAYLSGSVNSDGSISASGSGSLVASGSTLGPVTFSVSIPGELSWSDYSNSITQIAQFFQNAGTSASDIVSILEQLGYNDYDILNALGSIGDYSSGWLDDLASAFGFSTTYFDIVADDGQVLDVSGGSQSPSTQVITYPVDGGYNQDWEFVQSPYSGWYDVVNRGSGQCLTVQYNTATPGNSLIQYPCNDGINQLWYMGGSISTAYTYVMWDPFYSNGTEEVADIQNANVWPGAIMDQWTYNGGWNQEFTLANSTN